MSSKKNILIIIIVIVLTIFALVFWRGEGNNFSLSGGLPSELTKELGEAQTYEATEGDFSFVYPEKLKITEEPIIDAEGGQVGKRILAESSTPEGTARGFEIVVLPFDEDTVLTKKRILQDVPEMAIKNEKNIKIGGDIGALAFESQDENIGTTYEIWFAHSGFLYQARTYKDFGPMMEEILKQWRFK